MHSLVKPLVELYHRLRGNVRQRWKQDLPLDELLFDRWERARSLGYGKGTSMYHNSYVFGDVTVGENTWIGPYTLLDGSGGLTIGDYCSISTGVQIYTHDTVKWAISGGKAAYERAPTTIGNCCYIGPHTVVVKGITIGDHSVIGAAGFVNRDVPPYSIVVGIPCRVVGTVDVTDDGKVEFRYS